MSATAVEVAPAAFNRWWYDWIDPAQPAAGAVYSYTVGGEAWLRVLAARLSITTSATVANRFVSLDYINARGITYVRNGAAAVITASTTAQAFEWNYQRTVSDWNTNTPIFVPCLDTWLPPGFKVQFSVDAIDTTDQISALHLYVQRYASGIEGGPENAFPWLPGV